MRIPPACRVSAEMKNIGQIHAVFRTIDGFGSQVGALRPRRAAVTSCRAKPRILTQNPNLTQYNVLISSSRSK